MAHMQTLAPAPVALMHNQDADNELRAQLRASMRNEEVQAHGYNNVQQASSSASPHDHNIDPAIGGAMMAQSPGTGDEGDGGRKGGGKRELSQSKRAAQNRAAQRAFRQRKEGYIKKLEQQVAEVQNLEDNFNKLRSENYTLRDYIIMLQSRLIEIHGECPPAPPNVNLNQPGQGRQEQQMIEHHQRGHEGQMNSPVNPLEAQATRSLAIAAHNSLKRPQESQEFDQNKRFKDDEPAEEEMLRSQLQQGTHDGLPPSM